MRRDAGKGWEHCPYKGYSSIFRCWYLWEMPWEVGFQKAACWCFQRDRAVHRAPFCPSFPCKHPLQVSLLGLSALTHDEIHFWCWHRKAWKQSWNLQNNQEGELNILMYFSCNFKGSFMISEDSSHRGWKSEVTEVTFPLDFGVFHLRRLGNILALCVEKHL